MSQDEHQAFTGNMYMLWGRLMRDIGHDLRNPLGLIAHAAYLLKLQIEQGDSYTLATVDIITNAVGDIEVILDGMRDFIAATQAEPAPYYPQDILSAALAQLTMPGNISCQIRPDDGMPVMLVDGDQLQIAFRILAAHCLRALPDGGSITITLVLNQGLDITFAHNGRALTEDQTRALFDPFKSDISGVEDLAMPLAQFLIEQQHGNISILSGSQFLVHLPVVHTESQMKQ